MDVIAQAVASALAIALPDALAGLESRIVDKLQKPAQKKKPTAFKLLQQEAKNLGINTFGKSAAVIKAEIEQKKAA